LATGLLLLARQAQYLGAGPPCWAASARHVAAERKCLVTASAALHDPAQLGFRRIRCSRFWSPCAPLAELVPETGSTRLPAGSRRHSFSSKIIPLRSTTPSLMAIVKPSRRPGRFRQLGKQRSRISLSGRSGLFVERTWSRAKQAGSADDPDQRITVEHRHPFDAMACISRTTSSRSMRARYPSAHQDFEPSWAVPLVSRRAAA
jgi:hypothetical protein